MLMPAALRRCQLRYAIYHMPTLLRRCFDAVIPPAPTSPAAAIDIFAKWRVRATGLLPDALIFSVFARLFSRAVTP